MDPNLPKYLVSSLAEYFKAEVDNLGVTFFVETIDEARPEHFQTDSVVFKMNGPILYEGSKDYEWYRIEIHLLVTDIKRHHKENPYAIYEWVGALQKAMQAPMPIYKFAENEEDDELIGCLEPDRSLSNNIRVVNYFMEDRAVDVHQQSIHGRYILCT